MNVIMHSIISSWRRIESWLEANAPEDYFALMPPARDSDLEVLENQVGFPLHSHVADLLRACNGVASNTVGGNFFLNARLNDSLRIADEFASHIAIVDQMSREHDSFYFESMRPISGIEYWLPIARMNSGAVVYINHQPGASFGEVGEFSPHMGFDVIKLAASLADLLDGMANSLENGVPLLGRMPSLHAGKRALLTWS
ncbi:SMI1/KNR4 family protein [Actinomadura macrotermitis]|uniref:SMI1/KNR4 family protein n=1 Tax=Actinomadura macrotermitis TaxID=2585200 RepID=UPI0012950BE1|nr:SMI1/KNR4 family protein [Actinomadura macrotermitis]